MRIDYFPELDGPQSYRTASGRMILCKGGGGGSSQAYYENANRLYGIQADTGDWQLGLAKKHVPALLDSMAASADIGEAKQNEMAGEAMGDIEQGSAAALASTQRQMTGMGVDPSRYGTMVADMGLSKGLAKAAVRPAIRKYADQMSWARKSDMLNAAQGQATNSASNLASAAGGMSSIGNAISTNDANQRASRNSAIANTVVGAGMLMMKDGGPVSSKPEVRLFRGGMAGWENAAPPMPAGGTPPARGGGMVKTLSLANAGKRLASIPEKLSNAGMATGEALGKGISSMGGADAQAMGLMTQDAAVFGPEAAASTAEALSTTAATEAGIAPTVGMAEGAGALAGMSAALPWIGAGLAVASILDDGLFARGGDVRRKDMRAGGKVTGPGTETSDSVRARLSAGEFVENAEAVKLPRDVTREIVSKWDRSGGTTKELLSEINSAGLELRDGDATGRTFDGKTGEELRADGGVLGALGAIGSGLVGVHNLQEAQADREQLRGMRNLQMQRIQQGNEENQIRLDEARRQQESSNAIRAAGASAFADEGKPELGMVPAPQMSVDPALAGTGQQQSQPERFGMKKTTDLSSEDRFFRSRKAMFEAAAKGGRSEDAGKFYTEMRQVRDGLLTDAMARADRSFHLSGGRDVSGYIDAYNKYIIDGNTIDSFKRNDDGSFDISMGGAKQRIESKELPEYIAWLRDPKNAASAEMERAKKAYEFQLKSQEELNKPQKVGKDETLVIPSTGQTFSSPRSGAFDVKEANPVMDDARKMILERSGNFDQASGKWNWSPEAVTKAQTAERLFMKNSTLTPAMMAEIADKGTVGNAVVEIGGKQQRVPAVSYNGRTFLLGGSDAGMTMPTGTLASGQPSSSAAPGSGSVTTTGLGTRSVTGKISQGMTPVPPPTTTPEFPKVSQTDQGMRDVEAGKLLVAEAGGVDAARRDLAEIDASLKNQRLDGTQRAILQGHRNRLEAGIAAVAQQG